MALPSKINPPWTLGQARAAVNSLIDHLASTPTGGTDPEVVRDTIAAALVAGTGVSITPNDVADTITISATGTGGTVSDATTTTKGVVELATTAETTTGTDTVRAVTPAGVKAALDARPSGPVVTILSTATHTVTEAGEYVAGRDVTVTMPNGANVALAKGQFVVVVDVAGSLYVSEVGTLADGGPIPTPKTQVTPTGPTWTDNTTDGGGTWSTPTQTGVTYSPASGTATPGQSVTVTATETAGYEFPAGSTTTWSHTFPAKPVGPPTITNTAVLKQAAASGATLPSHTFTDVALGAEAEDRVVLITTATFGGSSVTGIKVNGINLSSHIEQSFSPYERAGIFSAPIPSGSTGSIEVTFGGSGAQSVVLGVNAMTGVTTAPYATKNTINQVVTIPPSPAGCLAVVNAAGGSATGPYQWGVPFSALHNTVAKGNDGVDKYYNGSGSGITTGDQSTGFAKANGFNDATHCAVVFAGLNA